MICLQQLQAKDLTNYSFALASLGDAGACEGDAEMVQMEKEQKRHGSLAA